MLVAFIQSQVDQNVSKKKYLPKNEAFNSQDTKPCDCLGILFIISDNCDGGLLQMRNSLI